MSGIGINIGVQSREVKEAKRDVDFLNKALKETEGFEDITPGKEGLKDSAALIKQVTEDIRRMKGLVTSGERQGGLLKKEQFQEAATLSKRLGENFAGFTKEIAKARNELEKLISEKVKLSRVDQKGGFESPADYTRRQARLKEVQSEIDSRTGALDEMDTKHSRMRDMAGRGLGYNQQIGGFGEASGPGSSNMKKALGWGAAIVGGGSVLSFLMQSMAKATAFSGGETDLGMRGGRNLQRGITYGYSSLESMEMSDALNRRTGYGGKELNRATENAKRFSRGMGIESESVTGYMTGTYQATGMGAKRYDDHLKALRDTATALGARGRIEDILRGEQQLLVQVSRGMGGKEANVDSISSLQALMWSQKGMIGKGQSGVDTLAQVDESIRGGGNTPGQQLFMFKALGGDSIHDAKGYWDFKRRMRSGINDPHNFRDVMRLARTQFGTDKDGSLSYTGRGHLQDMFNNMSEDQIDLMSSPEFYKNLDKSPKQLLKEVRAKAKGSIEGDAAAAGGTLGGLDRSVKAGMENLMLEVGKPLLQFSDEFKAAVLEFKDAVERGDSFFGAADKASSKLMGSSNSLAGTVANGLEDASDSVAYTGMSKKAIADHQRRKQLERKYDKMHPDQGFLHSELWGKPQYVASQNNGEIQGMVSNLIVALGHLTSTIKETKMVPSHSAVKPSGTAH